MAIEDRAVSVVFGNPAGAGDNPVVAAVVGKKIRVHGYGLFNGVATANTAHFRSGTTPISMNHAFGAVANGQYTAPFLDRGYFETNPGEALNLNLSAATAMGFQVAYSLVG